jgi:hypothetical protein
MLAQTVARKFGVPYGNQVDWLVAAKSGIAGKGDPLLKPASVTFSCFGMRNVLVFEGEMWMMKGDRSSPGR